MKYVNFDIVFQEIPDEVTLALNLSNCPNRCPGCHSPWLQENRGEELTEAVLLELLARYSGRITCVCFMGGDAVPQEVMKYAKFLRCRKEAGVTVGWYSGRNEFPVDLDLNAFDYIKLGEYREASGGLKSPATNQRLYKVQGGKLVDMTGRLREEGL